MSSPLLDAAKALAEIGLDRLEDYCRDNPPDRNTCKWCDTAIVSTPWFAPSGTFHMAGGGWMHEATESSQCDRDHPYRFAEP